MFDGDTVLAHTPELLQDFAPPLMFASFSPPAGQASVGYQDSQKMQRWHIMSVGGKGAGLPWHVRCDTVRSMAKRSFMAGSMPIF